MSFKPNPERFYRIQNVDFKTYLEVRDVECGSRVIMRPRKESDKQMWSFIAAGRNIYYIENAATADFRHPLYLTINSLGVACEWEQPGLSAWTIVQSAREDGYSITMSIAETYHDVYLAVNDDGKISYLEEQRTNSNSFGEDRTWRFLDSELTDSNKLPDEADPKDAIPATDNGDDKNDGAKHAESSFNVRKTPKTDPPPAYSTSRAKTPRPLSPPLNLSIRGHTKSVDCASFSPDGKYIVSGSRSNDIQVWDARTGISVFRPLRLNSHAHSATFSPDGRRVGAGLDDGTILVWDLATGETIIRSFKAHLSIVKSVSFSPDGRKLLSSGCDEVRIWDAQTGDLTLVLPWNRVDFAVFSEDGKRIAIVNIFCITVVDARSGQSIWTASPKEKAKFAAFSANGQTVVSAGDGEVSIWDADTGALIAGCFEQHAEGTLAVHFASNSKDTTVSPDGKWIAMGDLKGTLNVWNSKTRQLAFSYKSHTRYITGVAFSPDSKRVLSASMDATIQVHTLDI